MHVIKTIVKAIFLGAFVLGFIGGFVGAVVASLFIWPGSNLGPPVGAVYGLFWGVMIGAVIGLAWGMIKLFRSKPPGSDGNPGENAKTP